MFAVSFNPKNKAIREGGNRRKFSAYSAKRVVNKVNTKAKEKRSCARISMFLDKIMDFNFLDKLVFSFFSDTNFGLFRPK